MEEGRKIKDYTHSPAHLLVLLGDHDGLRDLLSSLPRLSPPTSVLTAGDAVLQSSIADKISSVVDRRDVPGGDTPLHLAVRLSSVTSVSLLLVAGADPSLQNSGWTPLQESLSLRRPKPISLLLLRHHRLSAFSKFRRRLPSLLLALSAIPDFYLELSFSFDSSLIPFLSKAAPSDTYRIWKRGADLRADTTLAGFDGLRVRRADQTFLFLASSRSLLVLDRARKTVRDAFDGLDRLGESDGDEDDDDVLADAGAFRPGLDITRAELVRLTTWRRRERVDLVGDWRAKVYEVHNVVFSFKTLKPPAELTAAPRLSEPDERMLELELDDEAEEGFLVAEIPSRHSCYERGRDGAADVVAGRRRRSSVDCAGSRKKEGVVFAVKRNEKEIVKNLKPMVWLAEDFPLKTEELLPMLDILANKVKAVRRLRELLTTKFPPGTFPVKVSIPVLPTVRVVVTFTKFVDLEPTEQFFTPLSSPMNSPRPEEEDHGKPDTGAHRGSWLKWGGSSSSSSSSSNSSTKLSRSKSISPSQVANHVDPFAIPSDYTWINKGKSQKAKKPKSTKAAHKM